MDQEHTWERLGTHGITCRRCGVWTENKYTAVYAKLCSGSEPTCEEVLDAFSVEANHERKILDDYLRRYPQYAGELLDWLREREQWKFERTAESITGEQRPLSLQEIALIEATLENLRQKGKAMRTKLMNSAMMPAPGQYTCREISKEKFASKLRLAHENGTLDSFIGYKQNTLLIKEWTGVDVPVNQGMTEVDDGDHLLIMKLRYRVAHGTKGAPVDPDEFEFLLVEYRRV